MKFFPDWLKKTKKVKVSNDLQFILKYGDLKIGKLYRENEKYIWEYEEEFKKQDKILPLASFSNKDKKYESKNLDPFFISRIPDPNRPIIKEEIAEKGIDKNDVFQLLKHFGRRNGNNPFFLECENV